MRTAVVRVNLDPTGELDGLRLNRVVDSLRRSGIEVLAPDLSGVQPRAREIELLLRGDDPAELRAWAVEKCIEAMGAPGPEAGTTTFVSRGTDEDALGVARGFGVHAKLERYSENDNEVVVLNVSALDAAHVTESRLRTALEAALNCEVRIVVAQLDCPL